MISIDSSMQKRYMLTISEELDRELEKERKRRMLDSIPETARMILSEYLTASKSHVFLMKIIAAGLEVLS